MNISPTLQCYEPNPYQLSDIGNPYPTLDPRYRDIVTTLLLIGELTSHSTPDPIGHIVTHFISAGKVDPNRITHFSNRMVEAVEFYALLPASVQGQIQAVVNSHTAGYIPNFYPLMETYRMGQAFDWRTTHFLPPIWEVVSKDNL